MEILQAFLWAVAPSTVIGVFVVWLNHKQKERDVLEEKREHDRLKNENR